MNKIEYQLDVFHDSIHKPLGISFFESKNKDNINSSNEPFRLVFFIPIDLKPILILDCCEYNRQLKLYEHGINYIIDNKIAKYNRLQIITLGYDMGRCYDIILYFDIIDKDLLIQLL